MSVRCDAVSLGVRSTKTVSLAAERAKRDAQRKRDSDRKEKEAAKAAEKKSREKVRIQQRASSRVGMLRARRLSRTRMCACTPRLENRRSN
jgi:hypothetical protein